MKSQLNYVMISSPLILLTALIGPLSAEISSANDALALKRAPMGFQGMRGKKDLIDQDFSKRAPMGFQVLWQNDYDKRAPMGFQGMRGKKSDDESISNFLELPEEDFEKRAMTMGFQGMRGKKNNFEPDWEKRAQMGFQGMRGKKSLQDEIEDLEKRAIMGFQGMRGKKDVRNGLEAFLDDFEKRTRTMGFQGMRGKKDYYEQSKRAPMGFQGMRGKKALEEIYETSNDFEKRAPMGFQGMRGKENEIPIQFDKRSHYGYYDMRGKKNPRWEILGKFVGVRGKKSDPAFLQDHLFENIDRIGQKGDSITTIDMQ
ncbi:tachykinins isoform X3 [Cephus cinctus]|uniref:Tachykinins isoform X3 n=1 Tax=Cephus cinctus TaxID=211228 RepID=A0AAJ7W7R4_CEPCN|nr:tachykinins isoform X3 [Cephus cinctus]